MPRLDNCWPWLALGSLLGVASACCLRSHGNTRRIETGSYSSNDEEAPHLAMQLTVVEDGTFTLSYDDEDANGKVVLTYELAVAK